MLSRKMSGDIAARCPYHGYKSTQRPVISSNMTKGHVTSIGLDISPSASVTAVHTYRPLEGASA